jgi:hypothetical protein
VYSQPGDSSVMDGARSEKLETYAPSLDQYETQAKPLDFRKARLNQLRTGQLVYFEGRVGIARDKSFFLVWTKKNSSLGTYIDDEIIVRCPQRCNLIEGDIVRFAARYNGVMTYETILGGYVELPEFFGDHYVLSTSLK